MTKALKNAQEEEIKQLKNKLIIAEGKRRFVHQVDRDENFVLNIVKHFILLFFVFSFLFLFSLYSYFNLFFITW